MKMHVAWEGFRELDVPKQSQRVSRRGDFQRGGCVYKRGLISGVSLAR